MERFLNIIVLFAMFCFMGWVWECIYQSIYEKKIVNRGFLHGPYIPIYGVGAVGGYIFFDRFRTESIIDFNSVELYIMGLIAATILEYVTSYLLEKIFKAKWWDYSDYKFNLNGRVCLIASLFWGVACVFLVQIVNPFLMTVINKMTYSFKIAFCSSFITCFLIDLSYTISAIINLKEKIDYIYEIENEKFVNGINKIESIPKEYKNMIASYKEKFYEINNSEVRRLILAFPQFKLMKKGRQNIFIKIKEKIKKEK